MAQIMKGFILQYLTMIYLAVSKYFVYLLPSIFILSTQTVTMILYQLIHSFIRLPF